MDRNTRIAAGVIAGAGAAAAATKAVLDRRDGDAHDSGPSRVYRLERGEGAAAGLRRIAAGRAEDAIEQLRERSTDDFAGAVHEARKDLKKLRSVLRLVREGLGDDIYRRENVRFRDTGRLLAGTRDAEVKLQTLASLRERFGGRLAGDGLAAFADELAAERDRHASGEGKGVATAPAATARGVRWSEPWPRSRPAEPRSRTGRSKRTAGT